VPSGSFDPSEDRTTVSGATPLVGEAPATAVGGTLATPTVIVVVAVAVWPPLSVTVSVTVNVPSTS
jgi:hypothetical protein